MENQPLSVGAPAPDFELMDENKNKVRLSDFRNHKRVVLLFYPMDFSPVCTEEHCAFGPQLHRIAPDDRTAVFGVSCDSPYTHAAFKKQYDIPYSLLSDPTRKMAKAYGMWAGEDPYNCTRRGTVIIARDGRINHYEITPMKEARKTDDIAAAVTADIAEEQRANEFGSAI